MCNKPKQYWCAVIVMGNTDSLKPNRFAAAAATARGFGPRRDFVRMHARRETRFRKTHPGGRPTESSPAVVAAAAAFTRTPVTRAHNPSVDRLI